MDALFTDHLLLLVGLVFVRIFTAIRLTPFLGGKPIPLPVSLGLSACLTPLVGPPLDVVSFNQGYAFAVVLVAKEVFIGACFGISARFAYSLLTSVGALTSYIQFPYSREESENIVGLKGLCVLLGTIAFLLMGGHRSVIALLDASFKLFPPGDVNLQNAAMNDLFLIPVKIFAESFAWGVMISAPVFVASVAAEVSFGIIARFLPLASFSGGRDSLRAGISVLVLATVFGAFIAVSTAFLTESIGRLRQIFG